MNSVFEYINLDRIYGKKVICFGCFSEARTFALRLLEQDIYFDYFLFPGEDKYCLPYLMNKQILGIKQLQKLNDYVVITSWKDFNVAHQKLSKAGLEKNLVEIEKIRPELINSSNIVIYGTGGRAEKIFNDVGKYMNISRFCDSNPKKTGISFQNKLVIHSSELSNCPKDTCVIIGSTYYNEIRKNILQYGIKEESIFYIDYDLTVFHNNCKKYTYKLKSLLDLLRDCNNKKIIMYGEKNTVEVMSKRLSGLGIKSNKLIERNGYDEDGTIYSLSYCDMEDTICIILDSYSEAAHDALINMGLKERQYVWLEKYNSYYVVGIERMFRDVLDPHLGYAHINENDDYPGFIKYGYEDGKGDPIVIVTLGGSTTSGYGVKQKSWSECLSEIFITKGINHVIYCGGINGYSISQELIKLIRDGIWIKPDFVISYSGVNNMNVISKTPFVHYYQKDLYDSLAKAGSWKKHGINYGVEPGCDSFEFWFTYAKIMRSLCENFNIVFKSFLQPLLYNKAQMDRADMNIAVLEGFLWNDTDNCLELFEEKNAFDSICSLEFNFNNALAFRSSAKNIDESWFYDLSDLFDEESGIYMDSCHVYEKGNQIIASRIFKEIENELKEKFYN